jgi:hypothetical protein
MESFSGNENTLIQNEGCAMFLNEVKCENEIMKETQEIQNLETKESRIPNNMKKMNNLELLQISLRENMKS